MTGFIERLSADLDHLGVAYEVKKEEASAGTRLEVQPANDTGFEVNALVRPDWSDRARTREIESIVVWYVHMTDGWYEEFDSDSSSEALGCFMSGALGQRRLAVEKRGSYPTSWSAEEWVNDRWIPVGVRTKVFLSPFWRKRTVEYLCNDRTRREEDS